LKTEIDQLRKLGEENYKNLMAPILAYFLTQLACQNDKLKQSSGSLDFNSQVPPQITVSNYLSRIMKYTQSSHECFLIAVIFMDKAIESQGFVVNSRNIHKILLTCFLLATKLFEDNNYNNKYYSIVGGIPIQEMNSLECHLLCLLNFKLNIAPETFEQYLFELERLIVLREDLENIPLNLNANPAQALISEVSEEEEEEPCKSALDNLKRPLGRSKSFSLKAGEPLDTKIYRHNRRRSNSFKIELLVPA